jgi:ubiquinone/menaquinone biosynthesis C-methylase UbiE
MPAYSNEPENPRAFTQSFDSFYTKFGRLYDIAVKLLPMWKGWLQHALPYLQGPRILEVSFGTGYLLTQYADKFEAHGIDFNEKMVATARRNLVQAVGSAHLLRGTVEALPYKDASFDSVLNTMAFTGYPDATKALSEMIRVLQPDGKLIIIDVNYPADGNWLGTRLTDCWKWAGDLIRDMATLFDQLSLDYTEQEIGGRGSVHLYVANKRS